MGQTEKLSCKKCKHCYWDIMWEEWVCDKRKHTIYDLNQWSTCKSYEERAKSNV